MGFGFLIFSIGSAFLYAHIDVRCSFRFYFSCFRHFHFPIRSLYNSSTTGKNKRTKKEMKKRPQHFPRLLEICEEILCGVSYLHSNFEPSYNFPVKFFFFYYPEKPSFVSFIYLKFIFQFRRTLETRNRILFLSFDIICIKLYLTRGNY